MKIPYPVHEYKIPFKSGSNRPLFSRKLIIICEVSCVMLSLVYIFSKLDHLRLILWLYLGIYSNITYVQNIRIESDLFYITFKCIQKNIITISLNLCHMTSIDHLITCVIANARTLRLLFFNMLIYLILWVTLKMVSDIYENDRFQGLKY